MSFPQWLTTAPGNATADPTINWAEGMAPSNVNDSARSMMAALAQFRDDMSGKLVGAGTATAYTVTTNEGITGVPNDGQFIRFAPAATNGLGVTLQVDGGTVYPIQKAPGSGVQAGTLQAGSPVGMTFKLSVPAWVLTDFYIQTATAAFVFPQDFGAVGDGVTDDTTAMQNAINAAQTKGTMLFIPNGQYKISTTLTITAAIRIMGRGKTLSSLVPIATINCLTINTTDNVVIEGLTIGYTTPATPGTWAIQVTVPGLGENNNPVIRDCLINNAQTGILISNAQGFTIDNCGFFNCQLTSILVQNINLPGTGESQIINCNLSGQSGSIPSAGHIFHTGSSGLRILGNKFLSGNFAYVLSLASGVNLENMTFSNNGVQGQGTGGLLFQRQAAFGSMVNVLIGDNIFEGAGSNAITAAADTVAWISNMTINDNIFNSLAAGANNLINLDWVSGFVIANNLMSSNNASTRAILTTANASSAIVGPNLLIGSFIANSILSGGTTQIAPT